MSHIRRELGSDAGLPLTPREWEVVEMVWQGASNIEIGLALCMSLGTVVAHMSHVYEKLELHSRVALALWYERRLRVRAGPTTQT